MLKPFPTFTVTNGRYCASAHVEPSCQSNVGSGAFSNGYHLPWREFTTWGFFAKRRVELKVKPASLFLDHVMHVFVLCAREKVIDINTARVVATWAVVKDLLFGNPPFFKDPHGDMRVDHFVFSFSPRKVSISKSSGCTRPKNAAVFLGALGNLVPKPFFKSCIESKGRQKTVWVGRNEWSRTIRALGFSLVRCRIFSHKLKSLFGLCHALGCSNSAGAFSFSQPVTIESRL